MSAPSLDNRHQPPYQGQQRKRQQQTVPRREHYVCSPIPAKTADFLLRRRLLLPTIIIPAGLMLGPPLVFSFLAGLTYLSGGTLLAVMLMEEENGVIGAFEEKYAIHEFCSVIITAVIILTISFNMVRMGKNTIRRHAPNKNAEIKALKQSEFALVFWSLVLSVLCFRGTSAMLARIFPNTLMARSGTTSEGWIKDMLGLLIFSFSWAIQVFKVCVRPAWGWGLLNLVVFWRFAGPLCSIVRCSCTPLKTNPFDLILQKIGFHFTSQARFLDMIAGFLDKLSAPSASQTNSAPQSGRYQHPVMKSEEQYLNRNNYSNGSKYNNNFPNAIDRSPSTPTWNNVTNGITTAAHARYTKPSFLSYLFQVIVSAIGGHFFAITVIFPYLGMLVNNQTDGSMNIVTTILLLNCMLTPVFELFINNGIFDDTRHEIHFSRYSSLSRLSSNDNSPHLTRVILSDLFTAMKISLSGYYTILCPLASALIVPVYTHFSRFHFKSEDDRDFSKHDVGNDGAEVLSVMEIFLCIVVSYISIAMITTILLVQEVLTRWAICAVGLDVDLLLSRSMSSAVTTPTAATTSSASENLSTTAKSTSGEAQLTAPKFLVEDLLVQSILCGDANTVHQVNAPPGSDASCFRPMQCTQDEEIKRNETASSSFADWIQYSSTTSIGTLSDDILRLCLLESLGGPSKKHTNAGTRLFDFGEARHTIAIRRRLRLSAATACPGKDPIAVPVVRSLCAFVGGMGQVATRFYHRDIPIPCSSTEIINPPCLVESWILPPGSLDAVIFAVNAAARLVVMNMVTQQRGVYSIDITKRHDRLSLLLPCVLRSAFQLHCGMLDYAIAQAERNAEKISSYDPDGKGDGLKKYIEAKLPKIERVLTTCDEAAKMVMRIIMESGERPMEVLMGGGNGDLCEWLVQLDLS